MEARTQRGFIDYSLDKRATLLALFRGVVDACDADPYLMRAAKFHVRRRDVIALSVRRIHSLSSATHLVTNLVNIQGGSNHLPN
jgi:hypothetical protein